MSFNGCTKRSLLIGLTTEDFDPTYPIRTSRIRRVQE